MDLKISYLTFASRIRDYYIIIYAGAKRQEGELLC